MVTRISLAIAALLAAVSFLGSVHAQAMVSTKVTKTAGAYKVTLIIGTAETMSMNAKGKADERMIGGKNATCSMSMHMVAELAAVDASKMQTCNHHVEVHVYNKSSGKVITNARVTITLQGQGLKGGKMTIVVPIMTMEGMHAGPKDFHYGNNVYAPAGKYTVYVTVNGVKVTFNVGLMGGM